VERAALKFDDWVEKPNETGISFLNFIKRQFKKHANKLGISEYKDLGCTLSFVLIKGNKHVIFMVGDSPAIIIFKDNTTAVFEETNQDFANVTTSILSSSAQQDLRVIIGDNNDIINKIILSTDGASVSFIDYKTKEIAKALYDNFNDDYMNQLLNFVRDRQHDDCAIAVIQF